MSFPSTSDERTQNNTFRQQYRKLTDLETMQVEEIKAKAEALLQAIDAPRPGREMSLAKTRLEECVMWAIKGITG